ncbi:MAG TPA: CGNR zinc finger domain-containing protein, partial [Saprospiraceae bacterium]|nr:CGNR zinc finger domain-containing protein [Saprospiraceae bacterium]
LRPLSLGEQPESPAFEVLNELIHIAMRHRYLTNEFQWVWDDPQTLYEILYPVIWNAAHVLTNLDHTRIGHCPSCKWVFYDTTRNRSRKWCDMEDCGSRHKALRYYHRTKSGNDHKIE